MTEPVSDLTQLLRFMAPVLNEGVYAFSSVSEPTALHAIAPLALVREREGVTLVAPEAEVRKAGLPILFRAAWITLSVDSDLQAVGFTAAFAGALASAGISGNVIAGVHHDHLFVPIEQAHDAMATLRGLQESAADHPAHLAS